MLYGRGAGVQQREKEWHSPGLRIGRRDLLKIGPGGLLASCLTRFPVASRAQATAPFFYGYNLPWFGYGHDFGTIAWGRDGIATGGWTLQQSANSQGFVELQWTRLVSGEDVLLLRADLQPRSPTRAHGEVYINLETHLPVTCPSASEPLAVDLEGATVRVRIRLPRGSAGRENARNGLQVFSKRRLSDTAFPSWYSEWRNLEPALEERFQDFSFRISNSGPAGYKDAESDVRKTSLLGLKLGTNDNAAHPVRGDVYIDGIVVERPQPLSSFVFEFDKLPIEQEFLEVQAISEGALKLCRLFVFADGRTFSGDSVSLTPAFHADLEACLGAASRTGTQVLACLFDFHLCSKPRPVNGVQLGGRSSLIRNPRPFIEGALTPLLQRYKDHPALWGFDCINEVEWVLQGIPQGPLGFVDPDPVSPDQGRQFVRMVADEVHRLTSFKVTLGSARREWLELWKGLPLDYYQIHWYDHDRDRDPFPWRPFSQVGLDKPLFIGEVPTSSSQVSFGEFGQAAVSAGAGGVCAWSCRARDEFSSLRAAFVPRFDSSGCVNAASQMSGRPLSPGSFVSLYGVNLALQLGTASDSQLPEKLGDTFVTVTDSSGTERRAKLAVVSPNQINFLLPAGMAIGRATVAVARGGGRGTAVISVAAVAPGVFTANSDGKGAPAGFVVIANSDGEQTSQPTFERAPDGRWLPAAIDVGGDQDQAVLVLFGTGIQGRASVAAVRLKLGEDQFPVQFAGPQGQFEGLDQVNVAIPKSVRGAGLLSVVVIVDGVESNAVQILFH